MRLSKIIQLSYYPSKKADESIMKKNNFNYIKSLAILLLLIVLFYQSTYCQEIQGERLNLAPVVKYTTAELMLPWVNPYPEYLKKRNYELGLIEPNRENLPQSPGAINAPQWPPLLEGINLDSLGALTAPQTVALTFTGATLADAGAFPPDVMGVAGPTQFIVFINGRLRTFNKTTGVADGILNANPDAFFSSVTTLPGSGQSTFTSDPNIRYDRLSGRWFLSIIDVTVTTSTGAIALPNRVLVAMSDGSNITSGTVWSFLYYQNPTYFDDYPSLGIDANALYIGTDKFTVAGAYYNTKAYVFNKASIISGSPTVTIFDNLLSSSTGPGPYAPRGVDNYDPNNTGSTAVGYFIGVDNVNFSTLMIRRITNPGGTPTISANISVSTTITTNFPVKVPHLGNTGGNNGRLDALDDRLFAAHLRNGRLWTAHNIGVNNTGTTTGTRTRNAARWYELQNLGTTPTVFQTGTLYDNFATNDLNRRNYWIPSIMVSGQGHAALGCSIAGTNERINGFTTGRLVGDASGTLRDGPGGTTFPGYTSSSTAYNPSSDPGGTAGRRWGDYSLTSLDPNDDMTMWTIQEFCSSTNNWGVRVAKLLAPPPVTPTTAVPNAVAPNLTSVNVVITGLVVNGSGFYDPGTGFLNRISASLPGGIIVNTVTYNSPTQVTLNLKTIGVADGFYTVTITNPDGQSATSATGILKIDSALPVELILFNATASSAGINLKWHTATEVNNYGFDVERKILKQGQNDFGSWETIGFIEGHGNSNSPNDYSFTDVNQSSGSKLNYRLKQIDTDGKFEYSKTIEVNLNTPAKFELSQNYPNPFNPTTTIGWQSPADGLQTIKVFTMLGKEVATLVNEYKPAGRYLVQFDAKDLPSGIYFYKIQAGNFSDVKKMILLK